MTPKKLLESQAFAAEVRFNALRATHVCIGKYAQTQPTQSCARSYLDDVALCITAVCVCVVHSVYPHAVDCLLTLLPLARTPEAQQRAPAPH